MSENLPELVSKKKVLVDSTSYYNTPRDATKAANGIVELNLDSYETHNGGNYFLAPSNDKVRVVLGKNWDHAVKDSNSLEKQFLSDWPRIKVFYDSPIELEYCDGTLTEIYGLEEYHDPLHPAYGLSTKEKIILKTKVNKIGGDPNFVSNWLY